MRDFSVFIGRKNYVQSTESSLQLIWIPGYATGKLMKDRIGYGYNSIIGIHRNDFVQWLYDHEDLKNITERLISEQQKSPNYLNGLIRLWRIDLEHYAAACRKMEKTDIASLSNGQLLSLYREFVDSYSREWSVPIIADAISLHSESLARHGLIELLKETGREAEFSKLFPILTAPVNVSFANKEKKALLGVLEKIRGTEIGEKIKKMKNNGKAIKLLLENPSISSLLAGHARDYHWIRNSYLIARDLKPADFASELVEMIRDGKDPRKEMLLMDANLRKMKAEKRKMIASLGVAGRLKLILEIIELFAWWQDERKKQNLIGDHYVCIFLNEFARRLNCTYYDAVFSTPEELVAYFKKGRIDVELMRKRRKFSVMVIGKDFADVFVGREAEALDKILLPKGRNAQSDDIRGQCASIGRAEGYVRIVNTAKDLAKMGKGDILVSSMTRPELVPAMKLAAAIVTDEGGITSHAAIISRELGIPCIIGTKIATKVLNDGDFIEVNANHGSVRKVE